MVSNHNPQVLVGYSSVHPVTPVAYLVTGVAVGRGGVTVAGLTAIGGEEGLPVAVGTHVTVGPLEVRTAETPASHRVASARVGPVGRTGTFWTEGSSTREVLALVRRIFVIRLASRSLA